MNSYKNFVLVVDGAVSVSAGSWILVHKKSNESIGNICLYVLFCLRAILLVCQIREQIVLNSQLVSATRLVLYAVSGYVFAIYTRFFKHRIFHLLAVKLGSCSLSSLKIIEMVFDISYCEKIAIKGLANMKRKLETFFQCWGFPLFWLFCDLLCDFRLGSSKKGQIYYPALAGEYFEWKMVATTAVGEQNRKNDNNLKRRCKPLCRNLVHSVLWCHK